MLEQIQELIHKVKYPVLLLLCGFIFLLLGIYDIEHIDKLKIVSLPNPKLEPLAIGGLIIILSVVVQVLQIYATQREIKIKNEKARIKIKEAEAEKEITKSAETIKGRRFANLIYIYAADTKKVVLGYHEKYEVFLPPGGRLDVYEMPHESILEYVRLQTGLALTYEDILSPINPVSFFVTDSNAQRIGETFIYPSPIWAQLEKHEHRPDYKDKSPVQEHYDFVFLCVIEKEVKLEGGVRKDVDWYSLQDVKDMLSNKGGKRTFSDVYEGFKIVHKYVSDKMPNNEN